MSAFVDVLLASNLPAEAETATSWNQFALMILNWKWSANVLPAVFRKYKTPRVRLAWMIDELLMAMLDVSNADQEQRIAQCSENLRGESFLFCTCSPFL